ncbi:hypothetical protein CC86DRAFT_377457 [Ophiobolus disseminans]|uniref:Uncharacterized protein n=1 Tax=Ophiobolus disseminans TaxID=1469910 RepID=A0A6A7AH65_9PLEO|nr:hypothetical protein CC86DRAFT_377457 [Ophiobolus disseminans]
MLMHSYSQEGHPGQRLSERVPFEGVSGAGPSARNQQDGRDDTIDKKRAESKARSKARRVKQSRDYRVKRRKEDPEGASQSRAKADKKYSNDIRLVAKNAGTSISDVKSWPQEQRRAALSAVRDQGSPEVTKQGKIPAAKKPDASRSRSQNLSPCTNARQPNTRSGDNNDTLSGSKMSEQHLAPFGRRYNTRSAEVSVTPDRGSAAGPSGLQSIDPALLKMDQQASASPRVDTAIGTRRSTRGNSRQMPSESPLHGLSLSPLGSTIHVVPRLPPGTNKTVTHAAQPGRKGASRASPLFVQSSSSGSSSESSPGQHMGSSSPPNHSSGSPHEANLYTHRNSSPSPGQNMGSFSQPGYSTPELEKARRLFQQSTASGSGQSIGGHLQQSQSRSPNDRRGLTPGSERRSSSISWKGMGTRPSNSISPNSKNSTSSSSWKGISPSPDRDVNIGSWKGLSASPEHKQTPRNENRDDHSHLNKTGLRSIETLTVARRAVRHAGQPISARASVPDRRQLKLSKRSENNTSDKQHPVVATRAKAKNQNEALKALKRRGTTGTKRVEHGVRNDKKVEDRRLRRKRNVQKAVQKKWKKGSKQQAAAAHGKMSKKSDIPAPRNLCSIL